MITAFLLLSSFPLGTGTDKLSREGLIDWDTNEVNGGDSGLGLGEVACDESGDSEP